MKEEKTTDTDFSKWIKNSEKNDQKESYKNNDKDSYSSKDKNNSKNDGWGVDEFRVINK